MQVKALYDPQNARAREYADQLGGQAVDSAEDIFEDKDVDVVLLFVPPWIRRAQIEAAAAAGKHILTTKPLAAGLSDCQAMVDAVERTGVRCGVMYRRTGSAEFETMRKVFASGQIGRLALYKQDWLHHYPQWNDWALDPEKNGGPFMDAMIHNLNIARYLMGSQARQATFFGDSHAHSLPCNDTEFLKVDFDPGRSAHLFITWAADLEVTSLEGNYREHIDLFYMVTDQGWRVTEGSGGTLEASKQGQKKVFEVEKLPATVFDRFAEAIDTGGELPSDIPSIVEARQDIEILVQASAKPGRSIDLDL
jgi:predicted dehydrogenase